MACLRVAALALLASGLSVRAARLRDPPVEEPAAKRGAPPEHVHQYREIKIQGRYYPVRITGPGGTNDTLAVHMSFTPTGYQDWKDVPVERMRPISAGQHAASTKRLKQDAEAVKKVPVLMKNVIQDFKLPESVKEQRKQARLRLLERSAPEQSASN